MAELIRDLFIDSEHEATKASEDELIVEGYFATYDLDHQNERWVPGSFSEAIKSFMANPSRPVLYEHKRELGQFGTVEALEERPNGLWGRMRLPKPEVGVLRQAWEAVRRGITRGVSVHAPMMMSRQSDGTAILVPKRIKEFSVTPFPINESSVVAVATKAFADTEGLTEADQAALDDFRAELQARFDAAEAVLADAEKSQRDEWAKKGIAMQDGSFPITHCGTDAYSNGAARSRLHSAKGKDEASIMAHIRKREKALGCKSGGAGD